MTAKSIGPSLLLKKPVVTEKSSYLPGGTYCFYVDDRACKTEIRDAVERAFDCRVRSVRTARLLGKPKGGMRSSGRRALRKKAYVVLAPGERIEVFEGV